ncbi:Uncharacterised protein [Zhongshania aliphaticivorans]|uniref:Uncharacterized protein n=1 Tax=Zhongshania aliphaticivorans TaxID=1470434 RepID=A0A5S9Q9V3_9GAMM|nr:hypothetical protein [Zhongshania aliphaticivorans]CAA0102272.1 Uncharacterised protein [Zhongshania aliphaticivorans]CAA0114435.1 Uncharacterised protein [Zhongshania aliphaticivorans]
MSEDIDNWLAKLNKPSLSDNDTERLVFESVRSGLNAAAKETAPDELALQRLHQRLESEGLYRTQNRFKSHLPRYGLAAAVLLGLTLAIDQGAFKPPNRAPLESSYELTEKDVASTADSYAPLAYERQAPAPSHQFSAAPPPAALAQKKSSLIQSEALTKKNADATQSNALNQISRSLSLTTDQWNAIKSAKINNLRLKPTDNSNQWTLLISTPQAQLAWIELLPKDQADKPWPIDEIIDVRIEVNHGPE